MYAVAAAMPCASRNALAALGLAELRMTWSFIAKERGRTLWLAASPNSLSPIRSRAADLSGAACALLCCVRVSLRCRRAQRNADRGYADAALFEVGQVFLGDGENDQRINAAAVRRAGAKPQGSSRHWSGKSSTVDAFDAKYDAQALLGALGVPLGPAGRRAGAPAWFHPAAARRWQRGAQDNHRPFRRSAPMLPFSRQLDVAVARSA